MIITPDLEYPIVCVNVRRQEHIAEIFQKLHKKRVAFFPFAKKQTVANLNEIGIIFAKILHISGNFFIFRDILCSSAEENCFSSVSLNFLTFPSISQGFFAEIGRQKNVQPIKSICKCTVQS